MRLFKLSPHEQTFGFWQWIRVAIVAAWSPLRFINYVRFRRFMDAEESKTMEQRIEEMRKIREGLEDDLARKQMWRR